MNEKELRELDAWIAENIFNIPRDLISINGPIPSKAGNYMVREIDHYSTDPAAAMEVLKKCYEIADVTTGYHAGYKRYFAKSGRKLIESKTIELAICLLAQELFKKEAP